MANRVLTELESAPLPEIVKNLGLAIGEAQHALDLNSVEQFRMMADKENGVQLPNESEKRSLLELGLTPSFYHFTEATIEARVAFSMSESREVSVSAEVSVQIKVVTIGMSASYTNRYSFESSGSSVISTKLVSVPPPPALAELVNRLTLGKPLPPKQTS